MPHHRTTTPTLRPRAPATMHAFTTTRTALTGEPGSDPQQGPAPFEAWVTDLPQTPSTPSASTSAGFGHTLTLQGMLRRRAKLARSLLLAATIGLPLVLMLHAVQVSSSPQVLLSKNRERAHAPWLSGHRGDEVAAGTLDIQPARMDGDVVYVCWVGLSPGLGVHGPAPTPLHLAVSDDGAYTWRILSSPVARVTACHLVTDASDSQRIALVTQLGRDTATGCPVSQLFASGDGGMRWSAVALPQVLASACMFSLSSVSGTLALWTDHALTSTGTARSSQLWISLDAGATLRLAGRGLPTGSIQGVISARADGALLVLMRRPKAATTPAAAHRTQTPSIHELWSCTAGCPHWQPVASVPGSDPSVYATPSGWLSPATGWGTLYMVNMAVHSGTGSTAVDISTLRQDGTWHPLPSALWLGIDDPSASTMPSRVVVGGPDGSLVVEWGTAATTLEPSGVGHEQATVGVLGMWGTGAVQWLTAMLVEPATSSVLAAVWDEHGVNAARRLTLWLVTRSGALWSMSVSISDGRRPQAPLRCQWCQ